MNLNLFLKLYLPIIILLFAGILSLFLNKKHYNENSISHPGLFCLFLSLLIGEIAKLQSKISKNNINDVYENLFFVIIVVACLLFSHIRLFYKYKKQKLELQKGRTEEVSKPELGGHDLDP